jgi:hypothetical protein
MSTLANPGDTEALLRRLSRLTADTPRKWGLMSAHQVVCHLSDSFKVVMGERPATSASNLLMRTLVRFIALHTPLRWPQGAPTMPEVNQQIGGTKPLEFARDVGELRALIERFAATPRDFTFRPHPAFGPLTEREWLHWGFRHTDHHLRQFGL